MWCDQYLAYDALSVGMKSFFDAKRVKIAAPRWRNACMTEVSYTHPAVRTHPETGRKALFIGNEELTPSFEGMTEEESRPLLDFLYQRSPNPDRM